MATEKGVKGRRGNMCGGDPRKWGGNGRGERMVVWREALVAKRNPTQMMGNIFQMVALEKS